MPLLLIITKSSYLSKQVVPQVEFYLEIFYRDTSIWYCWCGSQGCDDTLLKENNNFRLISEKNHLCRISNPDQLDNGSFPILEKQ